MLFELVKNKFLGENSVSTRFYPDKMSQEKQDTCVLVSRWRPGHEYGEEDTNSGIFEVGWVVECGFVIDKSTICRVMVSCVIRVRRED